MRVVHNPALIARHNVENGLVGPLGVVRLVDDAVGFEKVVVG